MWNKWKYCLCVLLFGCSGLLRIEAAPSIDVQEIVFSHLKDAYTWHITTWEKQEISIPLPILVQNEQRGWDCFLSSRLQQGATYHGYYLSQAGPYAGKVVYDNPQGEMTRPLDLSITKNVVGIWISSLVLVSIFLSVAHWYKKHPLEAPGGCVGLVETCVQFVEEGVIQTNVGPGYRAYAPYLLTLFFFILLNNLIGLIPIFPGGANVTGNISVTFVLALITFVIVNLSGSKTYWKEIFWPDTPLFLKCPVPIMPFVELLGIFTKPFALMIRLFANIMAGHTIILGLTSLVFISVTLGTAINSAMSLVSVLFCVFMNGIELLVAFIQAYVFTLLTSVYIGLSKA